VKHLSWTGYLTLTFVMVLNADNAFGQATQPGTQGATQPPAGQPMPLPAPIQSPAGQEKATPTPGQTTPSTLPPNLQRPSEADVAAASNTASSLTGGAQTATPIDVRMIGDPPPLGIPAVAFGPRLTIPGVPPVPGGPPSRGAFLAPSERGIKIANNESPEPQDRVYFDFNYFDNINAAANQRLGIDVHDIQVYQYTFGFEKTFLNGDASLGFRLPVNNLSTESGTPGFGGNFTDIGDLSVILKYLIYKDKEGTNVLSGGLAVTVPTGPDGFAGASQFSTPNPTVLQPFVGYRVGFGDFFLHGFFAGDFPTDQNDVTMFYTDVGIGYFLLKRPACSCSVLTAIVPTFEVHVNDPLNHRGAFNGADLVGTADVVDLTLGITFELNHRSTFTLGVVTPVTGPKPFDIEALAQVNWRFGANARTSQPIINTLQ
jgi:hypothetical protein